MITQRFPFSISFWSGSQPKTVDLRGGKHFRFDLDAVNTFCLEDLLKYSNDLKSNGYTCASQGITVRMGRLVVLGRGEPPRQRH